MDFLKLIGIKGKKRKVDVSSMKRSIIHTGEACLKQDRKYSLFIAGVDLNGHTLIVYLIGPLKITVAALIVYNAFGEEVYKNELPNELEFSMKLPPDVLSKDLAYIEIVDQAGIPVSNKQLINNLEKLFHTDPSKANRTINQVINGLETGSINEFEILSYLNDISDARKVPNNIGSPRFGNQDEIGEESFIEMTYEQAVEASRNPSVKQKIIRTHNSVRLWESISRLLLENIQRRNDDLEDEEEEGIAEISNVRKNLTVAIPSQSRKIEVEQLISQVERLVEKYKKSVTRVINIRKHKIDVIDFVQFLLVSHVVTALTYFNYGVVSKEKSSQSKLKGTFKHQMKDILTSFNKLLVCQSLENSDDHSDSRRRDYQTKTLYNSVLYVHLIDSLSPEPFMKDYLELLTFNLFNRLGMTDSIFEKYLDDISRTEDEVRFNVSAVIRLRNKLQEKYIGLDNNDKYFRIEHSGACFINEKNERNVRYESIFGPNQIAIKEFKKKPNNLHNN